MPTANRPSLVLKSIEYFARQDYSERELIIVDDSDEDLAPYLPHDERISYLRLPRGVPTGAKRHYGFHHAQGAIFAHWDDDDWFDPERLSRQVRPLLDGKADITGLDTGLFFDVLRGETWQCSPDLHRRLFVGDVNGRTLVFHRHVWESQISSYPEGLSVGEDAVFLRQALARGARLLKLRNHGLFLYVRHRGNVSFFRCGESLDPRGWRRKRGRVLPAADGEFYARLRAGMDGMPPAVQPFVSCIMPTTGRREHASRAIAQFLEQDYPARELVIVDDGEQTIQGSLPADPRIRYFRLDRPLHVGTKRNFACEQAVGEVIAHWDDDDWMAPWRISYQVGELVRSRADVCGLDRLFFYSLAPKQAWEYVYPRGEPPWLAGGTFCYWKTFWQRNPFADVQVGEDNHFVWSACAKTLHALDNNRFYAALVHGGNTSRKLVEDRDRWVPRPFELVEQMIESGGRDIRVRAAQPAAPPAPPPPPLPALSTEQPLASCITPTTAARVRFLPQLLRSFLNQTYDQRELIVVSEDDLAAHLPDHPFIRFVHLSERRTLGEKRNVACEHARGEVILHFDDDDYSAPGRIAHQIDLMRQVRRPLVGYNQVLYYVERDRRAYQMVCLRSDWCGGNAFCYLRELWSSLRFQPLDSHEDSEFQSRAPAGTVYGCDGGSDVIAWDHECNTWERDYASGGFRQIEVWHVEALLFARPKLITLGLLTWNSEGTVAGALDALLAEAKRLSAAGYRTTLVACDNGSADGTRDILRRYEDLSLLVNEANRGAAAGRNQIIDTALANGSDFLFFCDGDVHVAPWSVHAFVLWLDRHPEAGSIGANHYSCHTEPSLATKNYPIVLQAERAETCPCHYGLLPRRVFEKVRFDESFGPGWGAEDDYGFQMVAAGVGEPFYADQLVFFHPGRHSSIEHLGSMQNVEAVFRARREYLRQKWPQNGVSLERQLPKAVPRATFPYFLGKRRIELPRIVDRWADQLYTGMLDKQRLLALAATLCAHDWEEGEILVEIGAYTGLTTVFMAKTLSEIGFSPPILSVDPFERATVDSYNPAGSYAEFISNVRAHGFEGQCMALATFSSHAAPIVPDRAGVLVVDGCHHYPVVCEDLRLYLPKVVPGGYVFIDDYCPMYPDVVRAVDEHITPDSELEMVDRLHYIVARRTTAALTAGAGSRESSARRRAARPLR